MRAKLRLTIKNYLVSVGLMKREFSLIDKAARFVACEMLEGDYYEFGVYRGGSFINAYHALASQFKNRIAQRIGGENEAEMSACRQRLWNQMRFVAFDSFAGLPELSEKDQASLDFQKGQYACSLESFLKEVSEKGLPLERVKAIEGWFNETCNDETIGKHELSKAAIIWIDADLYSSTQTVLNFITKLLQNGTIIIFDDWFGFKGSPYEGVQRAFYEWAETVKEQYSFQEYQRESWCRMSFIASAKPVNKV